jgi:hypothetical protein
MARRKREYARLQRHLSYVTNDMCKIVQIFPSKKAKRPDTEPENDLQLVYFFIGQVSTNQHTRNVLRLKYCFVEKSIAILNKNFEF